MDFLRLNIKHLRTLNGLTQAQMADILDVSRDKVASYERGTTPPVDIIHTIVNHFHIRFNDLIEKDLSLFESKNVEGVIIDIERKNSQSPNRNDQVNDFENPSEIYRVKNINSLERVIAAQEITIQTQKETIQALREVIDRK